MFIQKTIQTAQRLRAIIHLTNVMMMGKQGSSGSEIQYGTIFMDTKSRQQQWMNISGFNKMIHTTA